MDAMEIETVKRVLDEITRRNSDPETNSDKTRTIAAPYRE